VTYRPAPVPPGAASVPATEARLEPAPAGEPGIPVRPVFDVSRPNIARVYNYWLGGKDNISQVVPAIPYSERTVPVQARKTHYSKIKSFAVRNLSVPCLGSNVRFVGWGFLTLA
jgi:S-adenosyl methyltransferase